MVLLRDSLYNPHQQQALTLDCSEFHSERCLPTISGRFIVLFNAIHLRTDSSGCDRDEVVLTTLPVVCAPADLALFCLMMLGNFNRVVGALFVAASEWAVDATAKADLDVHIKEDITVDVKALPSGLLEEALEDLEPFSSSRLSECVE